MSDTLPDPGTDLDSCAREPIHLLGHVQPYGCLIAVSNQWEVRHVSANLDEMLGLDPEAAIGARLSELLPRDAVHDLRGRVQMIGPDSGPARLYGIDLIGDGPRFDVSVHATGHGYLIEAEHRTRNGNRQEMTLVQPLMARVRRRREIPAMAREAARAVKAMTGFDRVMIYRFHPDDSGEVIAEAASPGLEPFLGLRYPASDIPPQARALYIRNPIRLIMDVDAVPCPVRPALDPEGEPLDLSLSVTRSVSPIHLEYLRNMGVAASMSVSILRDGRLWGLIACHHGAAHYVDYETRSAAELFTQLFAYEIAAVESAAERDQAERARALHGTLPARMSDGATIAREFETIARDIAAVVPCDGIAMWIGGRYLRHGATPSHDEFMGLLGPLRAADDGRAFASDCLTDIHPAGTGFADRAAGLLSLPISQGPGDYLVLFRREQVETVNWAGDPRKAVTQGPNGLRVSPRQSFEAWSETVRGRSAPWRRGEIAAAETLRVALIETVLKIADDSIAERKRAQERQELVIAELNHRMRNVLNLIRSLIAQSRPGARSVAEYVRILDGRVEALARAHDQLTETDWRAASLKGLIETEIDAFLSGKRDRVKLTGADVLLSAEAYATLALVLHEMVTNAAKYGALQDSHGRVEVTLDRRTDGALVIGWRESGGAPVKAPEGRGFGTTVIERSVPFELRGEAELRFALTGVEARFVIPARHVSDAPEAGDAAPAAEAPAQQRLSGRALVVEDNMIIALDGADILTELGCAEAVTANGVGEALRLIESNGFDLALLDVNLGNETSTPVAEALTAHGVPFVLATGYGATEAIAEAFPGAPVIKKPYTKRSLQAGFTRLLSPSADARDPMD
ncbi:HWE histidine kinase domain-containing protein [Limimaricola pyoseonensis]|uniref:histidine kinase n=1 Tax=Limimaricola pyoseonensis TaxID=521013 RepID=A0A1G7ECR1_9RHOB|nr:HWE histidine kinase domain-containing protein [Limimaricola pyoseonensis]SDE61256.1 Bacteriophytochrome (light-regulated signal transduction histidine kinase) [Limimaricola pyoseonensis]